MVSSDPAIEALRVRLDGALAARDRFGAVAAVLDAVRSGAVELDRVYPDILTAVLVDTGAAWRAGTVRVWEEHYITAVVRTIVEALAPAVAEAASRTPVTGKTAVLACPAGEQHDMGLRMLTDRLLLRGWRAHFLGADTPAAEVVAAGKALEAGLVVLSAATHYNLVLLRDYVDEVKAGLPGVRVGVGGPAFACNHRWPAEHLLVGSELGIDDGPDGFCPLPEAEG